MFNTTLRRLTTVFFMLGCGFFVNAQQVHFVYLQTENGQPFYVKLDNKVVSSSSAGYLILPKLVDGDYKLSIGFPKKEFPEEDFKIVVDEKNEGFLLKNFGEKGWGLFNMESYGVVMGGGGPIVADTVSKTLQTDPFSKMLANVVKDSSLLQKNEQVNRVVVPPKTDSAVAVVRPSTLLLSPAKRILSKKESDGMEMVYIDSSKNGNDTIRIFIPTEKLTVKTDTVNNTITQLGNPLESANKVTNVQQDSGTINQNVSTPDTTAMIDSKEPPKTNNDTTASITPLVLENTSSFENKDSVAVEGSEEIKQKTGEVQQPEILQAESKAKEVVRPPEIKKDTLVMAPEVVKSSTVNSDCKAFADNEDFLKLRKKMASESSDDNMIKVAKKAFRYKCFSTEQIKNLSLLFLTNEGKYRFFDEAYAFASDSNQYFTLQSQLTDSYYINRFKAMIHK
jgi:Domain of unknown function (DUF4476)